MSKDQRDFEETEAYGVMGEGTPLGRHADALFLALTEMLAEQRADEEFRLHLRHPDGHLITLLWTGADYKGPTVLDEDAPSAAPSGPRKVVQ